MGIGALQPGHLIVVLVIVLLIFGPGKLPELGKAMGEGLKELKKAQSTFKQTKRDEMEPEDEEMEEPQLEKSRPPETRAAQKEVETTPQQREGKNSFTFRHITDGVLELPSFIFFASLIVLCLWLNVRVIEVKKAA